jgi:UDP-2,3-diacylglucosamine pyrophosphatase LpxH
MTIPTRCISKSLGNQSVVDAGVPCYFIHGNRDFLVGQRFARQSGMILRRRRATGPLWP